MEFNLLPHRQMRKAARNHAFLMRVVVVAVVGALCVGIAYALQIEQMAAQTRRNEILQAGIKRLDQQIADIAGLRAEIENLKARQKAVEDLQVERNVPVHLLNELATLSPDGLYFSSVRKEGAALTLSGVAQTNERVSDLLRSISVASTWLEKPELVEIRLAGPTVTTKEGKRLFEFQVRVLIRSTKEVPQEDGGLKAPAKRPAVAPTVAAWAASMRASGVAAPASAPSLAPPASSPVR